MNEQPVSPVASDVADVISRFTELGVMPAPFQIVADIECGSGLAGFAAIRHMADATCMSIDTPAALEAARALAAEIGVEGRVAFTPGSATSLSLEDDSVHVAYVGGSVLSLDEADLAAFVARLRRVVLPGGTVYINGAEIDVPAATLVQMFTDADFDDVVVTPAGGFVMRRPSLAQQDVA